MAQVLIRNLSPEIVERLKQKALLNGRSLEQELREILTAAAPLSPEERGRLIDRFLESDPKPVAHDSAEFIREDRDAR